jgi:Uma2 family endonuclease
VIALSPANYWHSRISLNVALLLNDWGKRTGLGRAAVGETGIIVDRKPDTVRGADVVYYSYERLPKGTAPEGFCDVAPNLVVEVIGKGQGWGRLVEKAAEYLRMGVDRVWIVDPKTQRVHIYRSDAEPSVLGQNDTLIDEALLPGLAFKVGEIFAD